VLAALIDSPAQLRSAAEIWIRDQIDRFCEEDLRRIAEISPAPLSPAEIGQDPDRVIFVRLSGSIPWRI